MRFLSYLYHGLLCLILLIMSGLAMAAGTQSLNLQMLPASVAGSTTLLFGCALFGLITVLLAIKGLLRPLFFLWSLVVMILLVKGYFLSSYHFSPDGVNTALYLIVGSLIAVIGAWFRMTTDLSKRRS
jgi:hypothetical protein